MCALSMSDEVKQDARRRITITLSPAVFAMARLLSAKDRRDLSYEIEHVLEQEFHRSGLTLEVGAEPVVAQ